jgi:hypothetical protein
MQRKEHGRREGAPADDADAELAAAGEVLCVEVADDVVQCFLKRRQGSRGCIEGALGEAGIEGAEVAGVDLKARARRLHHLAHGVGVVAVAVLQRKTDGGDASV